MSRPCDCGTCRECGWRAALALIATMRWEDNADAGCAWAVRVATAALEGRTTIRDELEAIARMEAGGYCLACWKGNCTKHPVSEPMPTPLCHECGHPKSGHASGFEASGCRVDDCPCGRTSTGAFACPACEWLGPKGRCPVHGSPRPGDTKEGGK